MDGHGVDIGVAPAPFFAVVSAVNSNTGSRLGPFLKVVVVERLAHSAIHHAILGATPPAIGLLAEGVAFAACKEDVVDAIGTRGVAEARVGSGDVAHHVGDSLVAVEAVAPSESGIGPVDGHDGLILTFAHPVENVTGSDGGLNGCLGSDFGNADGSRCLGPGGLHTISYSAIIHALKAYT